MGFSYGISAVPAIRRRIHGASDELVIVHVTDGSECGPFSDHLGAAVPETVSYLNDEHDIRVNTRGVIDLLKRTAYVFAITTSEKRVFGSEALVRFSDQKT